MTSTPPNNAPPQVWLLVGLTGSGKSTYAAELVNRTGAVRLSVDDLLAARHGRYGIDYPEPDHGRLQAPILAEITAQMLDHVRAGRDTVLDHGLWLRPERDAMKALIEEAGGRWRLLYLDAPREVLLHRLTERNKRAAHDATVLTITPDALDDFYARFDPPEGEGEEIVSQR